MDRAGGRLSTSWGTTVTHGRSFRRRSTHRDRRVIRLTDLVAPIATAELVVAPAHTDGDLTEAAKEMQSAQLGVLVPCQPCAHMGDIGFSLAGFEHPLG